MHHLKLDPLVFERLLDLRPEEACVRAVTEILDVPHHVYFIEVKDVPNDDGEEIFTEQVAVSDPFDRLGDVQRLNDGRLLTVRVPGYEGDYAMVIFPFAQ